MPATEHFLRNQNRLHIVFAVSCVLLLVSTFMMMVEDQNDEWRVYQRTGFQVSSAAKARDIEMIRTTDYQAENNRLAAEKSDIENDLRDYSALAASLQEKRQEAALHVERLENQLRAQKGIQDEKSANFGLDVRDNNHTDVSLAIFNDARQRAKDLQLELEAAQEKLDRIDDPDVEKDPDQKQRQEKLVALQTRLKDVQSAIDKLQADEKLLEAALERERPISWVSKLKRWSMELPILDGFNSHLRIHQDWIPELMQPLGMTEIARFDRCRTCHINADKTVPGNLPAYPHGRSESDHPEDWVDENRFPHPYSTHPNPALYVTAASPHPVSKFGCTICHNGQGSGTSFGNAKHSPNDPHIHHEWTDEYGYHRDHFWEYPMRPDRFEESSCIRCHHSVVELGQHPVFGASAPKVDRGFQLIRKYGCFGCHEIHGFDAGNAIGPDMRLEPQTAADAERIAADPRQFPGRYRKVGPSLRHVAAKADADWIAYWTQLPSRFRPSTKMPQFFGLTNQQDEEAKRFEAVELAGIAELLTGLSEDIELLSPAEDYEPDAERGKQFFSKKGCLGCHAHAAVAGSRADFGPNISVIHKKVKRNADDPNFSDWLYTWIRDPERHHKRTKMPSLFYDVYTNGHVPEGIDPVADIVAFLLSQGAAESYESPQFTEEALDSLVELFLRKSRFSKDAVEEMQATRRFPQKLDDIKGDEVALATEDGSVIEDPAEWRRRKLAYVGRRTVSRYGCYGCHDIPGYEEARPVGTALHDWGRKDTSKLGLEHIEEFLHHHGEPEDSNFSSTAERVEYALLGAAGGGVASKSFADKEEEEREMAAAYFYDSLLHHGRPGFIWQKLRAPRSYDYMRTQTKAHNELLRMPKFPLKENEIEAIATFVLGLVADPPAESFIYQPNEREENRIKGEFLLAKYNCTGCHMVELPKVTFGVNVEEDIFATELTPQDHEAALDLLLQFRKPKQALTGESGSFVIDGEEVSLPLASFHGLRMVLPDPEEEDPEFRESGFDLYETLDFGEGEDGKRLFSSARISVPDSKLVDYREGRGGRFAEWLVDYLTENETEGNRQLAWQASPPPLYQEGLKVQTPWLYRFLLAPETIRYTTVLRMPRFNMSPEEARVLANYFAAVDGAEFPYQEQGATDQDYLAARQQEFIDMGLLVDGEDYLHEGWKSLNGPLCIKCHSLGGRKFKVSDPKKDIRGPDLNRVQRRLRSDWLRLWLYKPTWITPYTSMPVNFPQNNRTQFPDLFEGDPGVQVVGIADALLNYTRQMEEVGPIIYAPANAQPADAATVAPADKPELQVSTDK